MASEYHWLVTAGLVTSSVIAVTANLLLLVVFARRRGLRTVPNRFVINLLVTNLLSSILLIPLLLADQIAGSEDNNNRTKHNLKTIHDREIFVLQEDEDDEIEETESIISDRLFGDNVEFIETRLLSTFVNGTFTYLNGTGQSSVLCYLAQSSTSLVCTASIFSILLIGVNQYFAVIHSLRYHFYINKCRSMVFVGTSWFVAIVFSLLRAATQTDSSLWHFCRNQPKPGRFVHVLNTLYAFVYFFVVILLPFIAISVIYVCIYKAAHKNSERMRKSTSGSCNGIMENYTQVPTKSTKIPCSQGFDTKIEQDKPSQRALVKVHSAPNFLNYETTPTRTKIKVARTCSERSSSNFINSLRYKISNASVFRYREETRAAKISIIVIFMVLICYIPYGVILILNSNVISVGIPKTFNYVSLVLLVLSNIISPFLFAYRNRRIQRELGKFFGLVQTAQNRPGSLRNKNTIRNSSFATKHEGIREESTDKSHTHAGTALAQPFLVTNPIPQVVITCKVEPEKRSILKRVVNSTNWSSYKKCTFITVPDSCLSADARGSFSSASTQMSTQSGEEQE